MTNRSKNTRNIWIGIDTHEKVKAMASANRRTIRTTVEMAIEEEFKKSGSQVESPDQGALNLMEDI